MDDDKSAEKEMTDAIANLAVSKRDVQRRGFNKIADNLFKKGLSLGESVGLGGKKADAIYTEAYHQYKTGKFREARDLFTSLVLMNPYEYTYQFGLASSVHMMKEYDKAADLYIKTTAVDPENPTPLFHASDCYFNMNLELPALIVLMSCVELCGTKPEYATMKERAETILKAHPLENVDLSQYPEERADLDRAEAESKSNKQDEKPK